MVFRVIVLSLIINVLLIGGAACELSAPTKIENRTSEVLTVCIDEYNIGDIKSNGKVKNNAVFLLSRLILNRSI